MEQIPKCRLPDGAKAAPRSRPRRNHRSLNAEAREILADALAREEATLLDLLAEVDGPAIDFEPERLGLRLRPTEL